MEMSDRIQDMPMNMTQREMLEHQQRIDMDTEIREIAKDLQDRMVEESAVPINERLAKEQEMLTKLIEKPADSRFSEGNIIKGIRLLRAIRDPNKLARRPAFTSDRDKIMAYELVVRIIKYTSPLNDALEAAEYYWKFPTDESDKDYVVALAYDLLERGFKLTRDQAFRGHFGVIQENLMSLRTKIMAHLARLRIKFEAMGLDGLVPEKLRHQGICRVDENPLYAWVNLVKTSTEDMLSNLIRLGLSSCTNQDDVLIQENSFFHFKNHGNLIRFNSSRFDFIRKSALVQGCSLILQDKSDCLPIYTMIKSLFFKEHLIRGTHRPNGVLDPRTFAHAQNTIPSTSNSKAATENWYDGILSDCKTTSADSVIITHCGAGFQVAHMAVHLQCSVPQYLTRQAESTGKEDLETFSNKKFLKRPPLNVVAFGVPELKTNEITHFLKKKVGINNIKLYQDSFLDVEPDDARLKGAVAILVNPPSSGSALKDPVKYLCSEGGDEEILTHMSKYINHQESVNGGATSESFKADQAKYFEHALKVKKVKLIMYTTCSILPSENQDVVETVINNANQMLDTQRHLTMANAALNRKRTRYFTETQFEYVDVHEVLTEYAARAIEGPFLILSPDSACSGGFIALIRRRDVRMTIKRSTPSSHAVCSVASVEATASESAEKTKLRPTTADYAKKLATLSPTKKIYPEEMAKLMGEYVSEVIGSPRPATADPRLSASRPDKFMTNRLMISVIPAQVQTRSEVRKHKSESRKAVLQRIANPTQSTMAKKKEKFASTSNSSSGRAQTACGRPTMPNGFLPPALDSHTPGCECPRHIRKFPPPPPTA